MIPLKTGYLDCEGSVSALSLYTRELLITSTSNEQGNSLALHDATGRERYACCAAEYMTSAMESLALYLYNTDGFPHILTCGSAPGIALSQFSSSSDKQGLFQFTELIPQQPEIASFRSTAV